MHNENIVDHFNENPISSYGISGKELNIPQSEVDVVLRKILVSMKLQLYDSKTVILTGEEIVAIGIWY